MFLTTPKKDYGREFYEYVRVYVDFVRVEN